MGKGPTLALLLTGPALARPNIPAIGGVMGGKNQPPFFGITVIMSTIAGMLHGTRIG